jgi:hypothetical protein
MTHTPNGPVIMSLKTVSAGTTYDVPGSGRVMILIVHQEINLPHFPHNLLNPMQMRIRPKHLLDEKDRQRSIKNE